MTTIKEAFGAAYAEAIQTKNPEAFRDFVRSKVSNTNIAKAIGVSSSSVTARMKDPVKVMKMVAENADKEINLTTARTSRQVTIEDLPETL